MGSPVSRPSCLGERSRRPEEPRCEPEPGAGRGPPAAAAAAAPKPAVPNGSAAGAPGRDGAAAAAAAAAAARTPPPGGAWGWKPVTAREVTEVTEVTETIVTEIVEVTEYPAGEPPLTRTIAVLTERAGGAPAHGDAAEVSSRAPPAPEEPQDTLESLLAWVADMEELVRNQKPPSAEVKVAKAQLEEQKLLRRLLEERRPRVEMLLQDRPASPAPQGSGTETRGSSTQTRGSGTGLRGSGTGAQGSGTEIQGSGTETRGSGVELDGFGVETHGSGTESHGSSVESHRSSTRSHGSGTETHDSSTETHDSGMETHGSDMKLHGCGVKTHGSVMGSCGFGTESPGCNREAPGSGVESHVSGTTARGSGTESGGSSMEAPGAGTASPASGLAVPEGSGHLSSLEEKWVKLMEEAEARYVRLERILPAAQRFQEAVDSFQEWLTATERRLAQFWHADGCVSLVQDAHQQTQALGEEIRGRLAELEVTLDRGQRLMEMVAGEEAQLAQEKMESLRMRYVIAGQSCADTALRLGQALEASSRLGAAQEELAPWLSRMEKELCAGDDGAETPVGAGDQEKFEQALGSQLAALATLGERLEEIGHLRLDPQALAAQLDDQRLLAAEILQRRGVAERLLAIAEPLLRTCPEPLRRRLQPSVRALRQAAEGLHQRSGACAARLERAQSLLAQFAEALEELAPWLEETQGVTVQPPPDAAATYEAFREQQALLQCLREAIAEHRPLVGKLQRVSAQLAELSAEEAAPFQRRCREAEEQYGRLRERVGRAAAVLEDALPRYSQLSERLDLLRECLERLQSRLQGEPPARGDAAHLREQIRETGLALGELEQLGAALDTVQAQGDELLDAMRAADSDAAARGIQERAAELRSQWGRLRGRCQERERRLREALALAERFWQGLAELGLALSDTQHLVLALDEPGGEPEAIRARLRTMQALREELEALQGELDALGSLGVELMGACGDPDRPLVTRSLDDLYSSWHSLSRAWSERHGRLEEQLRAALSYRESMQRLLAWLEGAELRLAGEFLVGGDPDVVQRQLAELKEFKRELYQSKVEVESLRHEAGGGAAAQGDPPEPLGDFRRRWDRLEEEMVGRQHRLEGALLGLGQFQHQLRELLQWLSRTAEQLRGPALLRLDLQSCEIELAKHKVLRNDVMSHARTVQAVTEAGQGLLLASLGESVEGLRRSLQQLGQRWDLVQSQTETRQLELENNLSQVQDITLEMTELLQWLEQVELQLFFSKPAWGHPDTTKETLTAHLELCRELDSKQEAYRGVRERLRRLLASCGAGRPCSTEHSLRLLEHKWESVRAQATERKERLAEGLTVTTEFHGTAQELLRWLGQAEELLGDPAPPSFVLATVTAQIQEHKALVKEAEAHGEKLAGLEAMASRLRDFGGQREGPVVQSLVLAARERLARVLQRAAERGTALEEARHRAKQFSESQRLLLDWLEEVEQSLAGPPEPPGTQEQVKSQLAQHKAFQKVLRSKRPVYEATVRSGRALRERARLPQDLQPLEELLGELKERWDGLWGRAAERQHKLEENLLFSGKFTDALQALMDWLYRAEPQLSEDVPVGGDRDLVTDLMDKHKVFQKELGKRASCIRTLKRSVRELARGGGGAGGTDTQWLQGQVEELGARWDLVCRLSLGRQARLEAALRQAEEFHALVQAFLGRLAEAEKTLKYGVFPEEEAAVQECQRQLQEVLQALQCQELELECITSLAEEILATCHPDSVITLKSWVTVAKSRFQEVRSWAQQQGERLRVQGAALAAEREEVSRLIDWIAAAEESLALRDHEPLPEEAEQLEELSAQHAVFMEELNRKQPDVEKVTKSCKRKLAAELGPPPARRLATRRRSTGKASGAPSVPLVELEPQTPLTAQLLHRWQQLWLLALDRQYRLETAQQRRRELEEFAHFDFGVWRKRYMQWIGQMKSRVLDVFRSIDRDQDGRISQREFIESVLASKFPTNVLEMTAVAGIFDMNGDGFIDYYEFVSALHPNRDPLRRTADADRIQDEVNRQVAQCNCAKRFQVEQISANRYRFGESQQLRMVRILRSTLMVRVGGGWIALDEFLVKNDPCRVKGRTNLKINEKYLSSDAFAAAAAKGGGTPPAPSPKGLSPSRSNSSLSLYSSASAPSSPLARKSVLRRTRSGDRCPRARGSPLPDGAELPFAATEETLAGAPPEPPEGSPPERRSPCR